MIMSSRDRLMPWSATGSWFTGQKMWPIVSSDDLPEDVTSAEIIGHTSSLPLSRHTFSGSHLLQINWLSPVDLAVVPLV